MHIELCLTNWQGQAASGSQNEERERVCAVSVSQNGESEFLEDENIYR